MSFLSPFPVILPLFVAAILIGSGNVLHHKRVVDIAAIVTSSLVTIICIILIFNAPEVYWFGNHIPIGEVALGISFVIDRTGAILASFASLLITIAFLYSWKYFETIKNLYHSLMLLFLGGMTGFCLTGDMFNLFVFFELMSVAAYSLTGYKNEGPSQLQGALNFAVTNSIGGTLILFGIAFIYSRTGALNFAQAGNVLTGQKMDSLIAVSFGLITAGFFVKAAIVPFHFAGVDAHTVGPTPVLVIFSGIMSQLALYGIARIYWTLFSDVSIPYLSMFSGILFAAGALTIFIGSIMCYAESSLKRMLAFSTISNTGIILIGISAFNPEGLKGAVIFIVIHGVLKAALFMCTGILLNKFESVDEIELIGKGKTVPFIGILFTLAVLALTGLPFFGALTAKTIIEGAFQNSTHLWIMLLFLFEAVLTGGAMLRASGRIFLGLGSKQVNRSEESEDKGSGEKETRKIPGTPVVMTFSIIFLLLFAFGTAIFLHSGTQLGSAFKEFQNRDWYQSLVFNKALPEILNSENSPVETNYITGIISVSGIMLISFFSLFRNYIPVSIRKLSGEILNPGIMKLKSLHSGFVGDYIVWFILGVSIIGFVFVLNL